MYAEVRPEGKCPVTVRDGRLWLEHLLQHGAAKKSIAELRPEEKPPAALQTEVELEDVWFRYDRNGADIVRGISAKINKGELFCMVGGNGVGKSIRFRCRDSDCISSMLQSFAARACKYR